jgi:hypothetical protein
MEWFEKALDQNPVYDNELTHHVDLYSLQFDWIENNLNKGVFKLIIINRNEIIGFINLNRAFNKSATCILFNKKYIIKKKGLFNRNTTIYDDNNLPAATISQTGNGTDEIIIRGGDKIFWKSSESSNNDWICLDAHEKELVQLNPGDSFFKSGIKINIKDRKLYQKTVLLLIVFGIYNLINLKKRNNPAE